MQPAYEKTDPSANSPEAIERRRQWNEKLRELLPLKEPEPFTVPLLKPNAEAHATPRQETKHE